MLNFTVFSETYLFFIQAKSFINKPTPRLHCVRAQAIQKEKMIHYQLDKAKPVESFSFFGSINHKELHRKQKVNL